MQTNSTRIGSGTGSLLAGATGGRDGHLEVYQLALEPVEVAALTGDGGALLGEQWREVEVGRALLEAEAREPSGILGAETQPSQRHDEPQPRHVGVRVGTVAVLVPLRRPAARRPARTSGRRTGRSPRAASSAIRMDAA